MIDQLDIPVDARTLPIGYITEILGMEMYGGRDDGGPNWQAKAVTSLAKAGWPVGAERSLPIVQISALAPNEAGKSSRIVAGASLYWVGVHPQGRVGITTKDQKQLNEQIIPAIEEYIHKLEGYKSVRSPYYQVTTPEGGKIIAFVTDDAGRVEGLHGKPGAPLLWIIDEAKSVEEKIFQSIDRCGYQAIILCSSGGLMQGTFYQSQTKNRASWNCVAAGLKDCPHISPDKVKRIIDKWGENHPFTRSCVYGEFMEQDDATQFIFPHSLVMNAIENPPKHRSGLRIGFVDFAEGNAEYALAVRDGNKTEIKAAFREANKHAACARLIRAFKDNNLKEEELWGDAADKEALDILVSLGWTIHRQNFGAKARNDERFQSWSAEAWIETSINVSKGELIVPANDEILIAQLTSRQKTFTGRGKLGAEEKYDMRKRGVESPDRADAYCGANSIKDYSMLIHKEPFSVTGWRDYYASEQGVEVVEEMGACAGL